VAPIVRRDKVGKSRISAVALHLIYYQVSALVKQHVVLRAVWPYGCSHALNITDDAMDRGVLQGTPEEEISR
jgi:hypothetical protein